jgi:DNA repair protein RecN (Recombination protein N)
LIRELHIKNLALIEDISLEFEQGFTVFTGETGAGKSILIGAIGLLLGERAHSEHIRSGTDEAEISGVFELHEVAPKLAELLDENNIPDDDGTLIIRRRIQRAGRNRVLVNQTPVPLALLKSIGDQLIDLHGQHDHQSLLNPETPLLIIDSLPAVAPLRAAYRAAFELYNRNKSALAHLEEQARRLEAQREFIEFQYRELSELQLKDDEEQSLEEELKLLSSSTERAQAVSEIVQLLADERSGGVEQHLSAVRRRLQTLVKFDEAAAPWINDIENALAVLGELERFCSSYLDTVREQADPARIETINTRLARIQRLKKKHGCSFEQLLTKQQTLHADLDALSSVDINRSELERACAQGLQACLREGQLLSAARREQGQRFDRAITAMMSSLGFVDGEWKTELTPLAAPEPSGLEQCSFLVRTNQGEPFLSLERSASGGEIARLMLAIKTVLADHDAIPVLIFDEIDTGIGGVLAKEVGASLYRLSKFHQVLCISHLHQIASLADNHFRVYKEVVESRTCSFAQRLSDDQRIAEIARMLGGDSAIARSHAQELLKRVALNS